jgi:hypothetical protein
MSRSKRKIEASARRLVALALQLTLAAVCAAAQSSDPERPTPALSNEIAGRIAPRDAGDSRRTRHFYAFGAQPGDLELTVEGNNLEGDVDLFAAGTLRPLAKVTLYAGLGSAVTRTVFLRSAESFVLRVQARTPNDAEGSYRIRLGSTFVPAAASTTETNEASPAESAAASPAGTTSGRRVTSTGARIDEPRPEPTPDAAIAAATPEAKPEPAPTPPRRTARGRAGARRASQRAGAAANTATRDAERPRDETAARDLETPAETSPPPTPEEAAPPRPNTRTTRGRAARGRAGAARRGGQAQADAAPDAATPEAAAPAAPTGLELPGTRLVLELREGGRLEREMSEVRRVTVERGQIVVTLKSGRIERQPLANVLRMSIEP